MQIIDWPRYSGILVTQSFISILFIYLAIRILKRNFNRTTVVLSLFYSLLGIGLILNVIFLMLSIFIMGILLYLLYYFIVFLILFSLIFLIVFIINLFNINPNFTSKKQNIIILIYAISIFLLYCFPGGITINEDTNWTPDFSWSFLIVLYFYITCLIFIPTVIFSKKLYKSFEDENLKKKLKFFFIGIFGMFIAFYGLILFNTWHDAFFRALWSIISLIIIVPSGLLIYYGIGKNL